MSKKITIWRSLLVLPLALALACSSIVAKKLDDKEPVGTMDGGTAVDSGGTDAGNVVEDCTSERNGTPCGDGFICAADECVASRCGDGIIDARTEQCDDGDEVPGDGCEPVSCAFSCTANGDCDNAFPCDGVETCSTTAHECQAGIPPTEDTACELSAGGAGACSGGLCAAPGCGNNATDSGEDCDDGRNGDNADGCRDDCTYTCASDADCSDGDMCTGEEKCDTSSHRCESSDALDCDDRETCTEDGCDSATGCIHKQIDEDGDGFSPGSCGGAYQGGDCNDTPPVGTTIFPGAAELCDGIDNDCDGDPDNDTVMVDCLRDADGDGWGDARDAVRECTCPFGYIPPRADGEVDCYDSGIAASSVHPGVTDWYVGGYCPTFMCRFEELSWDYDCSRVEEQHFLAKSEGTCKLISVLGYTTCTGYGWLAEIPECGSRGSYLTCKVVDDFLGTRCVPSTEDNRPQECH